MTSANLPHIEQLRAAGLSWRSIGKEIGLSGSRAHQIMRATGANTGKTCLDVHHIRTLYFGGRTMAQVAKHSKCTKSMVSQALHMMGVEVRRGGSRRPHKKAPCRLVKLNQLHC